MPATHTSPLIAIIVTTVVVFSLIIFECSLTWGLSFRGRATVKPQYLISLNCSNETLLAKIDCPCALIGQKCYQAGSVCYGPNNRTSGDFGNGSPKRGVCGCRAPSVRRLTICTNIFRIDITAGLTSAATVDGCLCAYSTIPGLSMKNYFGILPIQFLLAVVNGTNNDLTPYINIDFSTLELYVEPFMPAVNTTQYYSVFGIDATNHSSNTLIFSVNFVVPVLSTLCPACTS
ncbi:uncharacterized protein LOC129584798 [Paramacrobiotus metropolitanus]|uniref:uncharacterized protein LOC129584798 n=1 Tax=Paramacrobiotus metropolitanus TaxID=2943436 RepID=UPI0024463822|nr:uncharacterized protein LOC129584798 [Paramacrobiotus metropolitanus]